MPGAILWFPLALLVEKAFGGNKELLTQGSNHAHGQRAPAGHPFGRRDGSAKRLRLALTASAIGPYTDGSYGDYQKAGPTGCEIGKTGHRHVLMAGIGYSLSLPSGGAFGVA